MFNVDKSNPIKYYNEIYIEDSISILLSVKGIKRTGHNSFTYAMNRGDDKLKMIVIVNGAFVPKMNNGLNLEIDVPIEPFDIVRMLKFKGNFFHALNYVMYEVLGSDVDYIRVGTSYLKKIYKVDRYGITRTELKDWNRQTLMDDFDRDILRKIPTYSDFTIEPNNKDYESTIDENYNLFTPFAHKPTEESDFSEEKWKWIHKLLKHIFAEQYELGLKYIKIMYDNPRQALPIFVLVSEKRMTGKTTFIDFFNILFGANAVVINPQAISSQFNSSYGTKNIIMIEESRFDSVQSTEKLKSLATQKKILINAKHLSEFSIPFFGKLIITSNDENKFSKVDSEEVRYWVRKIPLLTGEANHNILEDFVEEIPYFLAFLNSLPDVDTTKSRQVFTVEELETEALRTVKQESKPELQKEIELLLENFSEQNPEIETFMFTADNIKNKWFEHNNQISRTYINKILKIHMKLEKKEKTTRYLPFDTEQSLEVKIAGKPFTYKNPCFGEIEDEPVLAVADNDIPF